MKIKCVICNNSNGKRSCLIHQNFLICPTCCATTRNGNQCNTCTHFQASKEYQLQRAMQNPKEKQFIAEINPEVEAKVDQAMQLVEKGDLKKAETIVNALYQEYPQNHMVHYGHGVINVKKNDMVAAIEDFKKSVEIFPLCVEAHFNLANAYRQTMDIVNMTRSSQNVIRYAGPTSDLGKIAQDSLNSFEKAIRADHEVDLNTYVKAMEIFQDAFAKMEAEEWNDAVVLFKRSLMLCDISAPAHGNLGLCYGYLGEKQNALNELDRALEINPNYEVAIVNRLGIENLQDGEKIQKDKVESINYSLDYAAKKKSYIN
jgi:tetratricopeptide (TPR) repeat protein